MTQMPEMVALFNGFGGISSVLVATSEYWRMAHDANIAMPMVIGVTVVLSVIIGAVTFTGSMVAYGKLIGQSKRQCHYFWRPACLQCRFVLSNAGGQYFPGTRPQQRFVYDAGAGYWFAAGYS